MATPSTWAYKSPLFHKELQTTTQILVNNGYSNREIAKKIKQILDNHFNPPTQKDLGVNKIKLFYRGFFHKHYKKDEQHLRQIIDENVKPLGENSKILIYYKKQRLSQLLLQNRAPKTSHIKRHNVVYQFICPVVGCAHSYIGMTNMTLSKRLSCHLQEGAILEHFIKSHNEKLTRSLIVESTNILDSAQDPKRLRFLEATYILEKKPTLNTTREPLLLPTTQLFCGAPEQT